MFGFGKKRASNDDQALVCLRAASLIHVLEEDRGTLATEAEIAYFVEFAKKESNLKFSAQETQWITWGAMAGTSDRAFMESVASHILGGGRRAIPEEMLIRFLEIIDQAMDGFDDWKKKNGNF